MDLRNKGVTYAGGLELDLVPTLHLKSAVGAPVSATGIPTEPELPGTEA
jgi:hypothetical protein